MNKIVNSKFFKVLPAVLLAMIVALSVMIIPAFAAGDDKSDETATISVSETAETETADNSIGMKALGAGLAIGIAFLFYRQRAKALAQETDLHMKAGDK